MSRMSVHSGMVALAILCVFGASVPASGETFITFNVRTYSGNDTVVAAINAGGAVTGADCGYDYCYGFVRAPDGTIATFQGPDNVLDTEPGAINRKGAVTGYNDYGFLRKSGGKIINFGGAGTVPTGINDSGVIADSYYDTSGIVDGFIRMP